MYVGRFAPSPTGPLHFGSLLAATASYLDCRSNHGLWLLRIEDLDKFRERPGATENIIQTLLDYGFEWDREIIYQTRRLTAYQQALHDLNGHTYPCTCTRKQLIATARTGPYGRIYPGNCRNRHSVESGQRHAIRLQAPDRSIGFIDRVQGNYQQNLAHELGDFIILRSDKVFAYQLAVVVDDEWQGVTHVVRGADLLDNTPRQIHLQQALGYKTPDYLHIPMANNDKGQKLSKQTHAPALKKENILAALCSAVAFLGQRPPPAETFNSTQEFWDWAIQNWNVDLIPRCEAMTEPTVFGDQV